MSLLQQFCLNKRYSWLHLTMLNFSVLYKKKIVYLSLKDKDTFKKVENFCGIEDGILGGIEAKLMPRILSTNTLKHIPRIHNRSLTL